MLFLFSCKEAHYRGKFNSYCDSANAAHDIFIENIGINKDKSDCAYKLVSKYTDSADYYYKLLYPNGNPYDNKPKIIIPQCK